MLPDGHLLRAARSGPLDEWFAYTDNDPDRVMAGRDLPEVISELIELLWGNKDPWVRDAIEQLAGQSTSRGVRFPFPCCDWLVLTEAPSGTFATCDVCGWEDDNIRFRDPAYPGGANRVSLLQARENYRRDGRSDPQRPGRRRQPPPARAATAHRAARAAIHDTHVAATPRICSCLSLDATAVRELSCTALVEQPVRGGTGRFGEKGCK